MKKLFRGILYSWKVKEWQDKIVKKKKDEELVKRTTESYFYIYTYQQLLSSST